MGTSKLNLTNGSNDNAEQGASRLPDKGTVTEQNGNEWFVDLVEKLYTKDAGFVLSKVTLFEERTCYYYAAGDRKVPGFFIYTLLRSKHGQQWLNAIMDGCEEPWWLALQRAQRITAAEDGVDRS